MRWIAIVVLVCGVALADPRPCTTETPIDRRTVWVRSRPGLREADLTLSLDVSPAEYGDGDEWVVEIDGPESSVWMLGRCRTDPGIRTTHRVASLLVARWRRDRLLDLRLRLSRRMREDLGVGRGPRTLRRRDVEGTAVE